MLFPSPFRRRPPHGPGAQTFRYECKAQNQNRDRAAGGERLPRRSHPVGLRVEQHAPETDRLRLGDADAEVAHAGLRKHRVVKADRHCAEQDRRDVRQDMDEHNAPGLYAHELCVFNIVHLPLLGKFAAHDAGEARDEEDAEDEDDIRPAAAGDRHDDEGEQDARKRRHRVVDAHNKFVPRAAEVARESADDGAEARADGDRAKGDRERRPGALHDAAEDVAPEIVRAEQMRPAGGEALFGVGHGVWVKGRPEKADNDHQDHDRGDDAAPYQVVVRRTMAVFQLFQELSSAVLLTEPNARVDVFIRDIRDIVDGDDNERDDHDDRLHDGQIAPVDRGHQQPSHAGDVEYLFYYNTSCDNVHQCDRQKCNNRDHRVAHDMSLEDLPAAVAAAVRRAYIVLRELAHHAPAQELDDHCGLRQRDRKRRKDEVGPEARVIVGVLNEVCRCEKLKDQTENVGENNTGKKRGDRHDDLVEDHHHAVKPAVRKAREQNAEWKRDEQNHQKRQQRQRRRDAQLAAQKLVHRHIVAVGLAIVSAQEIAEPVEVAHEHRPVEAELGAQRRDLFRRRLRAEHSGRRVARNDLKGEKHQNGDCKDREDKDAYFF